MSSFTIEEFLTYKVSMFSGEKSQYSIHLPLPQGKAVLHFIAGDLPENGSKSVGENMYYDVYVKADSFADYIDILRNEKPLFFYYNYESKVAYITSSDEPVGENE